MSNDVGDDELDGILDSALEKFDDVRIGTPSARDEPSEAPERGDQVNELKSADEAPPEVSAEAAKAFEDALKALGDLGLDRSDEGEDVNEADLKLVEEFMTSLGSSFGGLGMPGVPGSQGKGAGSAGTRLGGQAGMSGQEGTGSGATPDVEKLVESIVGHLLSEDVLKSPMLQMRAAYAEWLPKHAEELTAEELARYTRQQELVEEICDRYEKGADSSAIMELLSKMQETGVPPSEVMKGLSDNSENGNGASLPGVPPPELDKVMESCGVQ